MKRCSKSVIEKAWDEFNRDYMENLERYLDYYAKLHSENPNIKWSQKLRRDYKLTSEDWHRMYEEQYGCCLICQEKFPEEHSRDIHIDHDHSCCPGKKSCGKCVRGLLCKNCNKAIGLLKEDPNILARAIKYLQGWLPGASCIY